MEVKRAVFGAVAAASVACSSSQRPVVMQIDCMTDGHMEFAPVARSQSSRPELVRSGEGALVVRVRRAGRDSVPLDAAGVGLYTDSASFGRLPAAWTLTDAVGAAALDPVAPREYLLRVRAIGHGSHAARVTVRLGFADTVTVVAVPGRC